MQHALNLFFSGAMIGVEEAPQKLLAEERFSSFFHAMLKKRFGRITSADFLTHARRFAVLCDKVYRGSTIELYKNRSIKVDSSVYDGENGELIDATKLTEETFKEMYDSATSVVLIITPQVGRTDIAHSFAKIEWSWKYPKTIFFYAQQGTYIFRDSGRPLEELLFKKMFFVPGRPPSLNFKVSLGVSAVLDEIWQ